MSPSTLKAGAGGADPPHIFADTMHFGKFWNFLRSSDRLHMLKVRSAAEDLERLTILCFIKQWRRNGGQGGLSPSTLKAGAGGGADPLIFLQTLCSINYNIITITNGQRNTTREVIMY